MIEADSFGDRAHDVGGRGVAEVDLSARVGDQDGLGHDVDDLAETGETRFGLARAACSWTRSSARMFAKIVLSTTPMLSPSWSRKARWISLSSSIDASSITARVSPWKSTGRSTIERGATSPSADPIFT